MITLRYVDCELLKRRIYLSDDALPNKPNGWFCDCGHWTNDKDFLRFHVVVD